MRKRRATHFALLEEGWYCVAVLKEGRKWMTLVRTGDQSKFRMAKAAWGQTLKRDLNRNGRPRGEAYR